MTRNKRARTSVFAVSLKAIAARAALLFFLVFSVSLLVLNKTSPRTLEIFRASLTDGVVSMVSFASAPVDSVHTAATWVRDIAALYEQNRQLERENTKLMQWQVVANELENENAKLRDLLKFAPSGKQAYTSARVAVDGSGPYQKSVLINAGYEQGVEADLVVLSDSGVVGRVIEVGGRSARVLLLTDINSRIPVMSENSRERAVAAGDNSLQLSLTYLPADSKITVGERIVTTSDGGVLPPGLPVGVVTEVSEKGIKVRPFADWFHLEYVSVVNFNQ